jgi:predicted DNA-binding protein (UPF0251 family)
MPDLPAVALTARTRMHPSMAFRQADFQRAMNAALRAPNRTQVEREDEVLEQWERVHEPNGLTQREAAEEMGLAHSTFRSYLAHARARRGK